MAVDVNTTSPLHGGPGTTVPLSARRRVATDSHRRPWGWRQSLFGVRSRIVVGIVLLLALAGFATVFILRQALLARVDERINQEMRQEVTELRQLIGGTHPDGSCVIDADGDGQCRVGRDPETGEPFGNDVRRIFTTFLQQSAPPPDETVLTFVDGRIYQVPATEPVHDLTTDPRFLALGDVTRPTSDQVPTDVGPVRYLAVPVNTATGLTTGVLVVAKFVGLAYAEVDAAVRIAAIVALAMTVLGSLLAFAATGQMLAPLQTVTSTARSITDSDLNRRIDVRGDDELSALAHTFNDMLDRLEGAFTAQRDFVNDAGHELRTPITIISGHLQLLSDDPDERRQTIAIVEDELDRMSRFVEDLLVLAKADRPDFLSLQVVDLEVLTQSLQAKLSALGDRDWRVDQRARGRVVLDRQRVTQAVIQLAQNAIAHTSEGDAVAIGTAIEEEQVRLWVRDSGPGVPADQQERIFERFARGGDGRRRSEGAGLGLAIVRAIAEAHGGHVELVSAPGLGATFTLVLPADGPATDPDAEARAS